MSQAEVREIDTSEWDRDLTPPRPSDHKKKVDHSFMRRRRLDPRGKPPNIMDENAKAEWDSGTPIPKSDSQRMARIKAAIPGVVIGPWKVWFVEGDEVMLAGWVRSSDGSWHFGAVYPKGYDVAKHPELQKMMDIAVEF